MDGVFPIVDPSLVEQTKSLQDFLKLPMKLAVFVGWEKHKANPSKLEWLYRNWWRHNMTHVPLLPASWRPIEPLQITQIEQIFSL